MRKNCVVCGEQFREDGKIRTCSKKCSSVLRRAAYERLKLTPKFIEEMKLKRLRQVKPCVICGIEFQAETNGLTCSVDCHRARKKRYVADNKTAINRRQRLLYRKNPEKSRQYSREWSKQHKEYRQNYNQMYRLNHLEEMKERNRKYQKENSRKIAEQRRRKASELKAALQLVNALQIHSLGALR